ncbi:MAG: phosphoglucomutase/phosphomannomutase family protein [Dehalococcoidia bacterium]|nr:phosphoglucomutase/phosphomannomutase family protein [Dehalococcoidia bacterium]
MNAAIKFGTDGWRAIIAEDYTFPNVRACAQGVAALLHKSGAASRGLVVGYDTRFASEDFARAVAETAAANDVPVYLCNSACPTPVVSYNIIHHKAAAGVVITASHNPPQWNGFKYKPEYGGSASPEIVAALEQHIARAQQGGMRHGAAKAAITVIDSLPPYLDHLRSLADIDAIRRAPISIVVDSMYGAGAGIFASLLSGAKAHITEIHGERNPAFPGMAQPEPIPGNLQALLRAVPQARAAAGLATDGDADRLGVVDEHGQFVTQLQTIALLALYLLEVRKERGALVKSITTTDMLFKLGALYNVPVFETPVGFKYVGPVMMRENALIGGEESGGYGFRGHIPERDGILSGLYILSMMVSMGKTPSQLLDYLYAKVGPHHYDRLDLHFDPAQRDAILARMQAAKPASLAGRRVASMDTMDGFRYKLDDGSWALVRFSGTEPLLRIYCETDSRDRVQQILQETRALTGV